MTKDIQKGDAQVLFLSYAFPCAGVTLARGAITKKEFNALEHAVIRHRRVSWKTLQRIFPAAWRRIQEVAAQTCQSPYALETIRSYYLEFHNQYICEGDGSYQHMPTVLKKLCRVEEAEVAEKYGDYYIVAISRNDPWAKQLAFPSHETRPVSSLLCRDAEVGDIVSVHYGYAVEKLDVLLAPPFTSRAISTNK